MSDYPNIKGVLFLSLGFFLLFFGFLTASLMAPKLLKTYGFDELGFYSLALLYFAFAITNFISPFFVNKFKANFVLMFGAFQYCLYVGAVTIAIFVDRES